MSDARRLRATNIIRRAHQHELDTAAAELAGLRSQEAEIRVQIAALDERRYREGFVQSIEAAPYIAGFLQAIAAQQAALSLKLSEVEERSDKLEESVRDKFIELHKWQVTCDKLERTIAAEDRKSEMAELDEVARTLYTLKGSPTP